MTDTVRQIKNIVKIILGRAIFIRPEVSCINERFGSEYGGWNIATGGIGEHSVVYSFGIGEDASFDTALINRFNLIVHAFDPTPKSLEWIKQQDFSDNFIIHEYGIAAFDGEIPFYLPDDPNHVSYSMIKRPSESRKTVIAPVKRLETIMKELEHGRIDIIKMDIEGAEYEVINDIRNSGIRPKQILVEFHHRFPGTGIKKTKESVGILKSMGYKIFSVSSNGEELGFILSEDN